MEWDQGTAFLRHTDKEGNSYVMAHKCWHMRKFIASQDKAAADVGGKAMVEVLTEAECLAEKAK